MLKTETLSVDLLTIDADTQARCAISEDTVSAYAEIIGSSGLAWEMGPLDVFHDGSRYMVADGFHRTLAALQAKRASVPCRIHKGTAWDALIYGMTANDKHGLRMSQQDKRRCAELLLDKGGIRQIDIAQMAGVSLRTVSVIAAERKAANAQSAHSPSQSGGVDGDANAQIAHSTLGDGGNSGASEDSEPMRARKPANHRSVAMQHCKGMLAAIDDLQAENPNDDAHRKCLQAYRDIYAELEAWK